MNIKRLIIGLILFFGSVATLLYFNLFIDVNFEEVSLIDRYGVDSPSLKLTSSTFRVDRSEVQDILEKSGAIRHAVDFRRTLMSVDNTNKFIRSVSPKIRSWVIQENLKLIFRI